MTVKTRKVIGRRTLHFDSLDDVLHDAEQLTAAEVDMLGNWSLGEVLMHLAMSMNRSIDGTRFQAMFPIRWVARAFKRHFLKAPMSPGFNMPPSMRPDYMPSESTSTEEGMAALREAVGRLKSTNHREKHPALGRLTTEEYDKLHCRHAEMHLSFAVSRKTAERPGSVPSA